MKSVCICLCLLLSACAINNHGAIISNITRANGAWIADVYGLGAHLRTRKDDPGLTLGIHKRSYIFPVTDTALPEPGWYFFSIPIGQSDAVSLHASALGIEIKTSNQEKNITAGLSVYTAIADVPKDKNMAMKLTYSPHDSKNTSLMFCSEEKPCQD